SPGVRADMERRFASPFDGVRVHTGPEAARSAQAIGARAYTVGASIVFAAGQAEPWTPRGRARLAHELAHVVQQAGATGAGPARPPAGGVAALEAEAREASARVAAGQDARVVGRSPRALLGQFVREPNAG